MTEETLFALALEKPAGAEREAFLTAACGDDAGLRERIEHLLRADEHPSGILDNTPAVPTITSLPDSLTRDRVFAGRFKLREKLGEGGMGEVWVADQTEPVQRRVALKVVRPGHDTGRLVARFEQERQALALMDHPNIARVLDAGVAEGRPYFVMELIKGEPITAYCDAAKLSPRERLELFLPVCHAVQHAHQKGIIHRDLKPSNIMIGLYDGKPVPKVIDFGVAKATGPRLTEKSIYTEVGSLIGTLEYMSPEQAELNNLDVDTRSDIYALGAVLYELLTGSVPFPKQQLQAAAFTEMLRIIKEVEPPKPSTRLSNSGTLPSIAAVRQTEPKKLVAQMRGELDWIVMKCLEKDRGRRYETTNGLALDLQRFLADEPVQAGPPSTTYRLRKFAHRNRSVLAAASAFVLLLVTAVVTLAVALVVVNRERQEKVAALEAEGKRRKQARAALDAMTSNIVEEWLAKQPVLLPMHKRYLEEVLQSYEEFAADTGQEEESRAGVAIAYRRVGVIRYLLGQWKDAEAAFERSREQYARLIDDFPESTIHQEDLGELYNELGTLFKNTGQVQQALTVHREAIAIFRRLALRFSHEPEYRLGISNNLNNLGIAQRNLNRLREAEEAYREALAINKQLVAQFSHETRYLDSLAHSYGNLGVLSTFGTSDRSQEAIESLNQAVNIFQQLVANDPFSRPYRESLALNRNNLGKVFLDMKQYAKAEEIFLPTLVIRKQLDAEFPSVRDYKRGLAITLSNLGIVYRNTNRIQDAEESYLQALSIHKKLADENKVSSDNQNEAAGAMVNLARMHLTNKKFVEARRLLEDAVPYHQAALKANPEYFVYRNFFRMNRWRMSETHLELKDHAAAAAAVREFLTYSTEPPRDSYTAAGLLAGCVQLATQDELLPETQRKELAKTYGDATIAALRQAIEKRAKEVSQMKTDPSLDPIRQRDDFVKLLTEVNQKN